jgi:hypothetical protein
MSPNRIVCTIVQGFVLLIGLGVALFPPTTVFVPMNQGGGMFSGGTQTCFEFIFTRHAIGITQGYTRDIGAILCIFGFLILVELAMLAYVQSCRLAHPGPEDRPMTLEEIKRM